MLRARFAVLLSSIVLAATLVPVAPAIADDTPTPSPTATSAAVETLVETPIETPAPDPTPTATPTPTPTKPPVIEDSSPAPAAYTGPGTVTVTHTGTPFVATPTGWPDGTHFTYRWYRGATAATTTTAATGTGFATASYTPNALDKFLKVVVTATGSEFTGAVTRSSAAVDYSIKVGAIGGGPGGGASVWSNFPTVGDTVHLEWNEFTTFTAAGDSVSEPNLSTATGYQWLRNGAVIAGATSATYVVTAADFNKSISARFLATAPGATPTTITSSAWLVQPLIFTSTNLVVSGPSAGHVLTANPVWSDPKPAVPAVPTYQWYRNGVAITGAKSATYTLVAADTHAAINVKVTLAKPGYTSVVLEGGDNYTLEPLLPGTVSLALIQGAHVGGTLGIYRPGYHLGSGGFTPDPSTITFVYQWLRDGVPIAGAGAETYVVQSADLAHVISVRVTASYGGSLASTLTSAPTAKIGQFGFTDTGAPIVVNGAGKPVTLSVGATGVTGQDSVNAPGGQVIAYQWLRDGAAIAGATSATYTPTLADYGTDTAVRLTYTAPGYTPYVKTSNESDYSLYTDDYPRISAGGPPPYKVGDTLGLVMPNSFDDDENNVTATPSIQWLRNGVAIAGATTGSYRLQSADKGTKISVRVTGSYEGYNSWTFTSAQTAAIDTGTLVVINNQPVVANTDGLLSVTLPAGTVVTPDVTYSYQWYRGGVAVVGKTLDYYLLTSLDLDKAISVKVTVSKANVVPASVALTSTPVDYSIKVAAPPTIGGTNKVGETLVAFDGTYVNAAGNSIFPFFDLQWLRNGVPIAGANGTTYELTAADYGKTISARFTELLEGYVSRNVVATAPTVTQAGTITDTSEPFTPLIGPGPLPGQVAVLQDGHFDQGGLTIAVQWKRNGVNVKGATGPAFTLASTDANSLISYSITFSKPGYTSVTRTAVAHRFGIEVYAPGIGVIPVYGDGRVGRQVTVGPDSGAGAVWGWKYSESPTQAFPTKTTYQWYRQTGPTGTPVAIPGATARTYTNVAADYGKWLRVRVTVSGPGMVPTSALSGAAGGPVPGSGIGLGVNTSDGTASTSINRATSTLTAFLTGGSLQPATPPPVLSYQWLRSGNPIAGATSSTYKLSILDYDRTISVQITVKRDKFAAPDDTYPLVSAGESYSAHQNGTISFGSTPTFGVPLAAPIPNYLDGNGDAPETTPTYTYTWFRLSQPSLLGTVVVIPGANKSTYTPTVADLDKWIGVTVTPHYPGYLTIGSNSPVSAQVQRAVFGYNFILPVVTKSAGSPPMLTAKVPAGTFSVAPTSYSYKWIREGAGGSGASYIPGATGATYVPTAADNGKFLRVQVTSSRAGYGDYALVSLPVDYNVNFTLSQTGTTSFVDSVWSVAGTGQGITPTGVSFTYQWLRNDVPIAGATGSSYRFTVADSGSYVAVRVRGTKPGFTPVTIVASNHFVTWASFAHTGSATPTVTATGADFPVLKASFPTTGQFSPAPTSYTYQWMRSVGESGTPNAIAGATASTYKLTMTDLPYFISVRVTVNRPGYYPVGISSVAKSYSMIMAEGPSTSWSGTQVNIDTVITATPTVLITPSVAGTVYSWRWYREDIATHALTLVKSSTGPTSSYKVVAADVNQRLIVKVHASKAGYLTQDWVQITTPIPVQPKTIVGPLSITTIYSPTTFKFTATPSSSFTTPGVTLSYRWWWNGAIINGATGLTYTVPVGKRTGFYFVQVVAKKPGYTDRFENSTPYMYPSTP